jgi:hypothetical protein
MKGINTNQAISDAYTERTVREVNKLFTIPINCLIRAKPITDVTKFITQYQAENA